MEYSRHEPPVNSIVYLVMVGFLETDEEADLATPASAKRDCDIGDEETRFSTSFPAPRSGGQLRPCFLNRFRFWTTFENARANRSPRISPPLASPRLASPRHPAYSR